MSYDIYLSDPVTGDALRAEGRHEMRGGMYALGGTTELHLNITYNYSRIMGRVLPAAEGREEGLRGLYGLLGAQAIPLLTAAIAQLGDDKDADYWKPTEGNVKAALVQVLAMSHLRPDGIWRGD